MVIKVNYNFVAVILSVLLVGAFFLAELAVPAEVKTDLTTEEQTAQVKLPVAMYHHILKSSDRVGDYVITPTQFEQDLKYIQQNGYTTITTAQLLDFVKNGVLLPEKPILITFDDGYETVHEYAYPLLKQYEMKAVISVIGKHTDIFSKDEEPHHLSYSHLSWEQLREMQQSGVFEVGNHSYDMHEPKGKARYGIRKKGGESDEAYRAALLKDIGGLSNQIEKEIGIKPTVFAYPFGALSKESKPILNELGFEIILTCEEKVNTISPGMEIPLRLKRFNRAGSYSTESYFKKLAG